MCYGGENNVSFLNIVKDVKEGESACSSQHLSDW